MQMLGKIPSRVTYICAITAKGLKRANPKVSRKNIGGNADTEASDKVLSEKIFVVVEWNSCTT